MPGYETVTVPTSASARPWVFELRMQGVTEAEAVAQAQDVDVPILLTALNRVDPGEFAVVPLKITRGDSGETWSMWAETAKFIMLDPEPRPADSFAESVRLASALVDDPRASRYAWQFARGLGRLKRSLDTTESWLAFLELFKVIEGISDDFGGPAISKAEVREQESEVVQRLQDALVAEDDPAARVRILERTFSEIADVRHNYRAVRIRRAAEVLGVGSTDVESAIAANKARNEYAAHWQEPNEPVTPEEALKGGLRELMRVALVFIDAAAGREPAESQ